MQAQPGGVKFINPTLTVFVLSRNPAILRPDRPTSAIPRIHRSGASSHNVLLSCTRASKHVNGCDRNFFSRRFRLKNDAGFPGPEPSCRDSSKATLVMRLQADVSGPARSWAGRPALPPAPGRAVHSIPGFSKPFSRPDQNRSPPFPEVFRVAIPNGCRCLPSPGRRRAHPQVDKERLYQYADLSWDEQQTEIMAEPGPIRSSVPGSQAISARRAPRAGSGQAIQPDWQLGPPDP